MWGHGQHWAVDVPTSHNRIRFILYTLCPRTFTFAHAATVELQWLEHLWNHENIFETGVVQANECYSLLHIMRHTTVGISFPFSLI